MRKILPALFVAHREGKLHQDGRIICVAKQDFSQEDYLAWVSKSAAPYVKGGGVQDPAVWQAFLARLTYLPLDLLDSAGYQALARVLAASQAVSVFYLATAPALFEPICANLAASKIDLSQARVVLEKPL
ncbi:MAG TPA: glucose-6-phosphate dehydrogenase, partial [Collimonas sp.]|nr:glucose-6-phosphate dehydrogenase [Collimonas sp.]